MKVFISWSGIRSKYVAEALRSWIPKVLQAIKPWMSEEDISTGTRWSAEIATELELSKVGIICITPENQHNPWVMFESGALSKTISETFVCPYLYDLSTSQLSGPMSQFQASLATKDGTAKIIQTLNKALGDSRIVESELDEIFDVWWPKLEENLSKAPSVDTEVIVKRPNETILEEILSNSREQMRREEIRLNAFQNKDQKIDTLMQMLEGWVNTLNKSTFTIGNVSEKFSNLIKERGEFSKNDIDIPADMTKAIKESGLEKLVTSISGSGGMTDMLQKMKELSVDSKAETNMLLNVEETDESEI